MQFRNVEELFEELKTSRKGLTNVDARKKRNEVGQNEIPPPINYPAWLCCLLPCLLRTESMQKFHETVPEQAHILRDGKWLTMDSHSVAPGDILRVVRGERVAADLRVFEVCFYLLFLD